MISYQLVLFSKRAILLGALPIFLIAFAAPAVQAQGILGNIVKKGRVNLSFGNKNSQNRSVVPGAQNVAAIKDENSSYQIVSLTPSDTIKYYKIAGDLFIDIGDTKAKYPGGYQPIWAIMGNYFSMPFVKVNYLQNGLTGAGNHNIGIGQVDGKAYVYISGFLSCNCMAPLLTKGGQAIINNTPQTFFTSDFWQTGNDYKPTQTPCRNLTWSAYDTGGWKLKIVLSIDSDQAITANATVESLTAQQSYFNKNGTKVSSVWASADVVLPNLMSVENAVNIEQQKEKEAREAEARRLAAEKQEREEIAAFEAEIKDSFQKVAAAQSKYADYNLECLKRSTYSTFVPGQEKITHTESYPTGTTDLNTGAPIYGQREVVDQEASAGYYIKHTGEKNTCGTTIIIKGITKLISSSKTIYYKDASIKLEPGEITDNELVIDEYYNAKIAVTGSTHYYKKSLTMPNTKK
ncbi:MAG TPA: hypothetical protein VHA56_12435 [Mucilaginibacter sp.]|nr:hypothetical protein [Mucilaginibacter sp.]